MLEEEDNAANRRSNWLFAGSLRGETATHPAGSLALVQQHQARLCAIVTATTALIAQPVASLYGIDDLGCTRAATVDRLADGAYTGDRR